MNAVYLLNVSSTVARSVLQILTALRRSIGVNEVSTLAFAGEIVSGKPAMRTVIADVLENIVTPVLRSARKSLLPGSFRLLLLQASCWLS